MVASSLDALDDDGRRHSAACAHGDQADLLVAPVEFVERSADKNRTGGSDGMAAYGPQPAIESLCVASLPPCQDRVPEQSVADRRGPGRVPGTVQMNEIPTNEARVG